MKFVSFIVAAFSLVVVSCGNGSGTAGSVLSAKEFEQKMRELPNAVILDVRTPGEFNGGHLERAVNVDWNSSSFDQNTARFDKSAPVMVYCLSGARSASAARHMRQIGFKNVLEMDGGVMKWRAASLPLTTASVAKKTGMTGAQFRQVVQGDGQHIVLVDFYADWCAPCKKMKPYLDEISKDMAASVKVVRINADENMDLCKELKVDALPVLSVYKNGTLSWSNVGFVEKAEVLKHLK